MNLTINFKVNFLLAYKFLQFPSSRLWYLARAQDIKGRGFIILNLGQALPLLGIKRARLYQWLAEGQQIGFFRSYKVRNNFLYLWLGAKAKVAENLGWDDWGPVALCQLGEVLGHPKELATEVAADALQRASYTAAKKSLSKHERKSPRFQILNSDELFDYIRQKVDDFNLSTSKNVPYTKAHLGVKEEVKEFAYCIHDSGRKLFVSKGFIPIGGSQVGIGELTGQSDRTVRRHLQPVARRQICQSKAEYKVPYQQMQLLKVDEAVLLDSAGHSQHSERQLTVRPGQIFKMGGSYWINRCNVYDLKFQFKSEARQRYEYWKRLGILEPNLTDKYDSVRNGV